MIAELINLIELTIDVIGKKKELNKTYFEQFIEPMWEIFTRINDEYTASFVKYADYCKQENLDVHVLVGMMKKDSIYTSSWRDNLEKMMSHLPKTSPKTSLKTRESLVSNFLQALTKYFYARESNALRNLRESLIDYLPRKADDKGIGKIALGVFENMSFYIRIEFAEVADGIIKNKKASEFLRTRRPSNYQLLFTELTHSSSGIPS